MGTQSNEEALDAFSKFYAVVLYHWAGAGRRVLWSPTHAAWLRNTTYSRYMPSDGRWLGAPGQTFDRPDGPGEEDCAAAGNVALSITKPQQGSWHCQRCWKSEPFLHFIAPDVYGDPQVYCVQVPSYSVVGSSGGQGVVKHWGSPFGCQSVDRHIDSVLDPDGPYVGPVAAYLYGEPLPAEEVIDREWCSRCSGTAQNVRQNAASTGELETDRVREQVKRHLRRLRRDLAEYDEE